MELPPRDFRARFSRARPVSMAKARRNPARQLSLRLAVLAGASLAAVGVHAASAQSEGRDTAPMAQQDDIRPGVTEPMPFEQPGESFPGSAYYYLTADPAPTSQAPAPLATGAHWDNELPPSSGNELLRLPSPSPAAPRLLLTASPEDRMRALSCLTSAIYYEAASEPDDGQRAVAQVVLNRLAHPSFPKTVCGVVYQGSERGTGCQFTFACDGAMARMPVRMFWDRAQDVARAALAGYVYAPVGLSTHYHTFAVHPAWENSLNFVGQIGAHRFYSFTGAAGQSAAFHFAYLGGEPMPGPHPRLASLTVNSDAALDPLALERNYLAALREGQAHFTAPPSTPTPALAPRYTSDIMQRGGDDAYRAHGLPGANGADTSSTVRPEYENTGRWISAPQ